MTRIETALARMLRDARGRTDDDPLQADPWFAREMLTTPTGKALAELVEAAEKLRDHIKGQRELPHEAKVYSEWGPGIHYLADGCYNRVVQSWDAFRAATEPQVAEHEAVGDDLLELAWGVIANAGGGDWTRESEEWRQAAARWRDRYHEVLGQSEGERTTMGFDPGRPEGDWSVEVPIRRGPSEGERT